MMHLAVRHIRSFPGKRRRPRHVHFAGPVEKIGLDGVVRRIEEPHAVGDNRVAIKIRSERFGGRAPHARIVLLHGQWFRAAFERNRNFLDVRSAKTERDPTVGVDFGRNQRRWRLSRSSRSQKQNRDQTELLSHGFPHAPFLVGARYRRFRAAAGTSCPSAPASSPLRAHRSLDFPSAFAEG